MDRQLVVARRQLHGGVQSGRNTTNLSLGEQISNGLDHRVTSGAVASAHPPQVPIELTTREKIGEGVLFDPRSTEIRQFLLG